MRTDELAFLVYHFRWDREGRPRKAEALAPRVVRALRNEPEKTEDDSNR